MRTYQRLLLGTVFFVGSVGGPSLARATVAEQDTPATRVAHAEVVEPCGFAPVVSGPTACTATLVHPRVIISAAHCGTGWSRVSFGDSTTKTGQRVKVDYCKTHPSHPDNKGVDWSFCVLKEPVTDLPVIPPAYGCEIDMFMKTDQTVTQVGYGSNKGKDPATSGAGPKRWAENIITKLGYTHPDRIKVGPNPEKVVACPGDSGGPLLVRTKDGSWRTIAIASQYNGNCGGGPNPHNAYERIEKAVRWIEQESKIDITPCFDADGTWNPTEECGGFYAGDGKAYGSWNKWCEASPKSGYSSTCGPAFGEKDDEEDSGEKSEQPPKISIESPKSGAEIIDDSMPTKVKIVAKVKGELPAQLILGLRIDGKVLEKTGKSTGPFRWTHPLDEGEHEIGLWYDIGKQKRQYTKPHVVTVQAQDEPSSSEDSDASSKDPSDESQDSSKGATDDSADSDNSKSPDESQLPGCAIADPERDPWGLILGGVALLWRRRRA